MARQKLSKNGLERRQDIIRRYRQAKKNRPATTLEIADWAMREGLWKPHALDVRKLLADELSQAMHEEYITDPQGRRVRAKHAARITIDGEQQVLWADIRDKNPGTRRHMEVAFQNRRQQIVGECRQLKTDVDSYNQNWNGGAAIQTVFDFTDDLAEFELANTA
jgi:hypothetical protein